MSTRKALILLAQVAFAGVVVWLAVRQLAPEWAALADAWHSLTLNWPPILASCLLVLASYGLLIAVWRHVVTGFGSRIPPLTAARIWFVSNLGKYVPGKVWQIIAMGAMSQRAGVSPGAAVGSSLLIAVINVLAGVAVTLVAASDALALPRVSVLLLAALTVAVALTPNVLPRLATLAGKAVGRTLEIPPLPHAVLLRTFAGCAIAWVIYGVAFQALAAGVLPDAGGATRYYIALFTASYIAGYVTPWAPGGIGVREMALVAQMEVYGLTTPAGALILAGVSRVWLTVLELVPGLLFLAAAPRPSTSVPPDDA